MFGVSQVLFQKHLQNGNPIGNLTYIYDAMKSDYQKCEAEYRKTEFASDVAKERFWDALEEYQREISRFFN